jgi:Transposase
MCRCTSRWADDEELVSSLPDGFVAERRVHPGSYYEIDVSTFEQEEDRATTLNAVRESSGGRIRCQQPIPLHSSTKMAFWFLTTFAHRWMISAGAVEGLNDKAKLTTRRAYGFRTFEAAEAALYDFLGKLPELVPTHKIC